MNYFFYKLTPPRPTFPQDITAEEMKLMQEHAIYWRGLNEKGVAIAVGPVADPKGAFGVAIVQLEDASGISSLGMNDPVIRANIGFQFETHPMPRLIV